MAQALLGGFVGERAPPPEWHGEPRRATTQLEVDHRAGEGAGDAVDRLHPGNHQLAEVVDVAGLGPHDHVVGPGDVLGLLDALDLGDLLGDLGCLANLGLNQDVRRHHEHRPPCPTAATDGPPPEVVPPTVPEAATLPRSPGPRRPLGPAVESGWKRCAHGTRGHQACQGSIWPIQAATMNLVQGPLGGEPRPRYARPATIRRDWSAYRGASAVPRPGRGWRAAC